MVGYICAIVPVLGTVYLGIKRPYAHWYNVARSILNEMCVAAILCIYGYFRSSVDYKGSMQGINEMMPYLVYALLLLSLIVNFACMAKYAMDMRKAKEISKQ